ncbi:MAG: hypothetical protein LBB11_00230, partial [Puniceicoccales bacterium]|nr:hypothetical protein [Puniceicoccales bacterium]
MSSNVNPNFNKFDNFYPKDVSSMVNEGGDFSIKNGVVNGVVRITKMDGKINITENVSLQKNVSLQNRVMQQSDTTTFKTHKKAMAYLNKHPDRCVQVQKEYDNAKSAEAWLRRNNMMPVSEELANIKENRNKETFSLKNLEHFQEIMATIVEKAATHLECSDEKISAAKQCLKIKDLKLPTDSSDSIPKDDFLKYVQGLKEKTTEQLDKLFCEKCNKQPPSKKPEEGKKLFQKFYPQALNQSPEGWKDFSAEMQWKDDDAKSGQASSAHTTKVKISLTPARSIECFSYLNKDSKDSEKLYGISSMNRNTEHAMNLWETKIEKIETLDSEQSNATSKPLFRAIRHGCTRGQESASKEILSACLVQKYGLNNIIPPNESNSDTPDREKMGSKKNPYPLQLANIQLMTSGS